MIEKVKIFSVIRKNLSESPNYSFINIEATIKILEKDIWKIYKVDIKIDKKRC